ncbi:MAG TPA: hypothetical protein VFJ50_10520 [Gemmatimonadales bacterium]|nr:hypothetical protein [Gemmatimonadales bacterium]
MHTIRGLSVLLAVAIAAACDNSTSLGDPTEVNVVDTFTIGSLEGTSIATASGFRITTGAVRTDVTTEFEFAYNIRRLDDGTYQRVLLPRAALGLTSASQADPGLQQRPEPFDEITRARSNGYVTDSAVPIAQGDRLLVRSRPAACDIGVPLYGKIEILSFADSMVTFRILSNQNCGFKDLVPGLPDN